MLDAHPLGSKGFLGDSGLLDSAGEKPPKKIANPVCRFSVGEELREAQWRRAAPT